MIKTENEYRLCLEQLQKAKEYFVAQRKALEESGLDQEQIGRALESALSFNDQLMEELEWFERAKKRNIAPISNLNGIGKLLIALRIANEMTQAELARKLQVDESQVSRDERNEYRGVTVERAQRILSAMEEQVVISVEKKGSHIL